MTAMITPPCHFGRGLPAPARDNRRSLKRPAFIAVMGVVLALTPGAGRETARSDELSGVFLVCKECLTVRGTFLTDMRGRDVKRLNYLCGEEVDPRLSPTDDRILFTSTRGGAAGLWWTNRDGQSPRRICDGDQGDWFPDGRRIALRRQGQIIERDLETGQETVRSPAGWKSCRWPACSPEGRKILFVAPDGGKDWLWLAAPGEAAPQRLVADEFLGAPRWAPRGDRIVYQGGAHLWLLDADGRNRRQLTTDGGVQRRPAWSPDGTAIAYCQGRGPKGPWQMAVIRGDTAKSVAIPTGGALSVLCADWGTQEPARRPEPRATLAGPAPRVRLWALPASASPASRPTEPRAAKTSPPADWATFCSQRKGWRALTAPDVLSSGLRNGCAVENDAAVLLLAAEPGAVLLPKSNADLSAIRLTLVDRQGHRAGPVETIAVRSFDADAVTLDVSWHSAGAPIKTTWTIGGSRPLVQVAPGANAGKLRIEVPLEGVVAPDRFANDLVVCPAPGGRPSMMLPWVPLVTGLLGNGSGMLTLICPDQGQRVELPAGKGLPLAGVDVTFHDHAVWVGAIAGQRVWHQERFLGEGLADPLRFKWRMPCPAVWRLAVQGDARRYSAFFSDKKSEFFDKTDVLLQKRSDFSGPVRVGTIYLYDRTAGTPAEVLTPVDLLRDALGVEAAREALDEDGLTGYRKASRPTTWAQLSVSVEALRYLFGRRLQVQDGEYARHLVDDLSPFVEGMDQRLHEYADFARAVGALSAPSDQGAAAARLLKDVMPIVEELRKLGQRQRDLRSSQDLGPACAKIAQLTARQSNDDARQFEACCKTVLEIAGPREEMVKSYRRLAIELRDAAGDAVLAGSEPVEPAEEIRALCQGVLRSRFYSEGDWRGEDYRVPSFWFGPRPYE